ncbi:lipocalin-like domain-containing protein [Parabacteroides timonensis]|uniref:lipocalin family protein n=1 Tax=Parabacteroides timonensis TaxID=1871013 RepID=UPI00094E2889|nr:lipocalin family protein [Parabacteroides timonensis]
MRKNFILLLTLIITICAGCSDDEKLDFDKDILIGKWKLTKVEINGSYVDVTKPPYSYTIEAAYATFNSDDSYYGEGYFGNGKGNYKASGKTITCYIDGKEYVRYQILNISAKECELEMFLDKDSMKIICTKQ